MVNLLPTPEQAAIVASVDAFLTAELPLSRLHADDPAAAEAARWAEMAGLGWFGLGQPEEAGGAGLDLAECALLFEAMGRSLISPSVLATLIAAELSEALRDDLLAGRVRAAVGIVRPGGALGPGGGGGAYLIDAEAADWVLLWDDTGAALYPTLAMRPSAPLVSLDWTLGLRAGRLTREPALWAPQEASPAADRAMLLTAAMLAGIAAATRDTATDYAKVREQFGKPIGAFQAVKHRCADMALRAEAAHAQVVYAALAHDARQADVQSGLLSARILAADAAIRNAEDSIQAHGGIGFTADAHPQLFVKRAHLLDQLGGGLRSHRRRLLATPPQ